MKHVWIGILIVTIVLLAAGAASAQTMGPGGQGGYEQPAGQGWFCPYCGPGPMGILSSAELPDPSPWFRSGRDQRPSLQRAYISPGTGDAQS